jgi:predicted membrane channel-forming protein YqfA (hemolysin III family)
VGIGYRDVRSQTVHYGRAVILVCWAVAILLALIAVAFAFADRRAGRALSRRAYITLGGSVVVALVGTGSVFI